MAAVLGAGPAPIQARRMRALQLRLAARHICRHACRALLGLQMLRIVPITLATQMSDMVNQVAEPISRRGANAVSLRLINGRMYRHA